jgi:hydroxymethylglutaryl-CoA lyase
MAERLHICEVGPRDGLQNEPNPISTADKLRLIEGLMAAGLDCIEVSSFVRPDLVPQMGDARELFAATADLPIHRIGLIINEKGYDRALAAGCRSMAGLVMVSETLSRRNSRMGVAESVQVAQRLVVRAHRDGVRMRLYISTAWVCPYEGEIAPKAVLRVADKLIALEPAELVLADTIGHAHPRQVRELIKRLARRMPLERLTVHLHDTLALGLANAYAAIEAGVRTFDASFGGLGGCPFAPGAAGNLATEDIVFLAHKLGFETGVDMEKLMAVTAMAEPLIGRSLGGRTSGGHCAAPVPSLRSQPLQ